VYVGPEERRSARSFKTAQGLTAIGSGRGCDDAANLFVGVKQRLANIRSRQCSAVDQSQLTSQSIRYKAAAPFHSPSFVVHTQTLRHAGSAVAI
jgi:hypothetical protein